MGDPLLECFSSGIPSIVCRGGGVSEQQKQPPEGGCRREQATRSAGGLDSICQNAAGDAAEPAPSFSGLSLKSIWVQIHRSSGRPSFPGQCRSQSFLHAEDLVIDAAHRKESGLWACARSAGRSAAFFCAARCWPPLRRAFQSRPPAVLRIQRSQSPDSHFSIAAGTQRGFDSKKVLQENTQIHRGTTRIDTP